MKGRIEHSYFEEESDKWGVSFMVISMRNTFKQ